MWNELVAHRSSNNVVSCLAHFIFNTRLGSTGAKWSIWWADNCAGQNKNHCVVWFFQDLIRTGVYSRVDYKFLVVGHTYGPTDRCFGGIEKYIRKIENVYTPQEWYRHVSDSAVAAASRVEVIEMQQEYFRNYYTHLHQMFTERSKGPNGEPFDFSKVVWFNFGVGEEVGENGVIKTVEHPQEVWLRYTYHLSETPRKVSFYKKSHFNCYLEHLPPLLYDHYPLPIKPEKAAYLKKLATQYLTSAAKSMYINLPAVDTDSTSTDPHV